MSNKDCDIYNKTSLYSNLYEGIPETLVLNVFSWLFLLLLFTFMRAQAWDYGRLALVNNNGNKKRWTQLFYAKSSEEPTTIAAGQQQLQQVQSVASTPNSYHQPDSQGLFSWIIITFKLKKDQILMHSGPDAVHYLSFQQHLMAVMGIITLISIVVILPINFQGNMYKDNSFGLTTISNLNSNSPWLYVHIIIAILYVPLIVLIMRRSSGRNAFKKTPTRAIMITGISYADRNKQKIRDFIQQLFPDINIQEIQLTYNIEKLTEKCAEYEKVVEARHYCETHRNRDKIKARPNFFSCETCNGLEYYQQQERKLAGEVARLRASALNEPLDIAFVTLTTLLEAQNIIAHFRPMAGKEWNIKFAPSPFDIFWENLNVGTKSWYLKWFFVNLILFLVLFFLTTPAIIVSLLSSLKFSKDSDSTLLNFSPFISEFLPTLMLWTLSALLPVLVAFSDKWLSHWTRSLQNYSIMTKTFGYLLFMILILPSLGLASAEALFQWSINSTNSSRWNCLFLPDKGAFFINYVITTAFIGTALELIRFPELIQYTWFIITAKSRAETPYIQKFILEEFPFGVHYAWTLAVFTISVVYSIACPLIMPFAMVYLCFKHFGDRHNLYFAYGPSNMMSRNGGKIHSTAITMTKFAPIILLITISAMIIVQNEGRFEAKSILIIIALCITLTLFSFMSPIKRCTMRRPSINDVTIQAPPYVAEVLLNKQIITNNDSPGFSGYGSDTRVEVETTESRSSSNHSIDT